MKVIISNLAWNPASDDAVFGLLAKKGIDAVEIAPTKYVPDIAGATDEQVRQLRARLEGRGISVAAFQALLFGKPEMKVFGDERVRGETLSYLKRVIDLASGLGAGRVIFGSPKNRYVEGMSASAAYDVGLAFFRSLGDYGAGKDVAFCIEPNAAAYGCNFMTASGEAAAFVREAASPGFKLHLDLGVMRMNGEDIERVIAENIDITEHFHVSEPHLKPVDGASGFAHGRVAEALRKHGYGGHVSIEMLEPPDGIAGIERALDLVIAAYGD